MDKRDYLKRRLQTVLVDKRLAKSPKGARQLITHRKVMVGGKGIDSPSYIVPIELEDKITIKVKPKKAKIKEKVEEKDKSEQEEANEKSE